MGKAHVVMIVLALGGGGYGLYVKWPAITAKLGLQKFDPSAVTAIELAKNAKTFDPSTANWAYLNTQKSLKRIKWRNDPWTAVPIEGRRYRVLACWTAVDQGDREVAYSFTVDVPNRSIAFDGEVPPPATAPR
jgi:hypothetical protein